jgi:hypothetical protein
MEGKDSDVLVQQKIRNAAEETNCGNASTLEKGDQMKAKPRLDAIEGKDNFLNTTLPSSSNKSKGELEKKKHETTTSVVATKPLERSSVSPGITNISVAAQPPPLSKPDNNNKGSKDAQNKNSSSPNSPRRKRTRQQQQQQPSPIPTTQPQQPQNLTRKSINPYNITQIWKRYDLTAIEMITAHETAELKAVQKQIWKQNKFVPYNGINSARLGD